MLYLTKIGCWNNLAEARYLQFEHLQYIKDLRMHSKLGEVVETCFLGGR
jgi:hypothetical protein